MAARPRRARASEVPSLSSLPSVSVSTRLTKKEATDAMEDRSRPAARACSMPSRKASTTWS